MKTLQEQKEELFKMHDRIKELKSTELTFGLSESEDLELRNLEVEFFIKWSDYKEGEV